MPEVGDRVRIESRKLGGAVREGVVTEVVGNFLHVQWSTGEESTFMPGPGSLTVLGRARVRAKTSSSRKEASGTKKAASAPTKKVAKAGSKTTAKRTAKKSVAKKSVAKKSVAKKSVAKKSVAKKSVAAKRPR